MATTPKIPPQDWMKVNFSDFGPTVIAAQEAKAKAYEALKASEVYKANQEAILAFESAFALALVEQGYLKEGQFPIVSRFGQIADPSKHFTTAKGEKSTTGKRTLAPAKLYTKSSETGSAVEKTPESASLPEMPLSLVRKGKGGRN